MEKFWKNEFSTEWFCTKLNSSNPIFMGESSRILLSNMSLNIQKTQICKHFLETSDYQDFYARFHQNDYLICCSCTSVHVCTEISRKNQTFACRERGVGIAT